MYGGAHPSEKKNPEMLRSANVSPARNRSQDKVFITCSCHPELLVSITNIQYIRKYPTPRKTWTLYVLSAKFLYHKSLLNVKRVVPHTNAFGMSLSFFESSNFVGFSWNSFVPKI